jgi:4-amino-4-deoxychorismate lyase
MSLLLETIRIEHRQIFHLEWHNARLNKSRRALLGIKEPIDLADYIKIPEDLGDGTYRCRVLYGREIKEVQFHPHQYRPIRSLKIIHCDDLDYSHKFANRERLQDLFALKGDCDEILIIKRGMVTDTYISNIALLDREGHWVTPDAPLLAGTMRQALIDRGRLKEKSVRLADLFLYREARMINCMMDLDSSPIIEIENIRS